MQVSMQMEPEYELIVLPKAEFKAREKMPGYERVSGVCLRRTVGGILHIYMLKSYYDRWQRIEAEVDADMSGVQDSSAPLVVDVPQEITPPVPPEPPIPQADLAWEKYWT
jgi:hypothetical protein